LENKTEAVIVLPQYNSRKGKPQYHLFLSQFKSGFLGSEPEAGGHRYVTHNNSHLNKLLENVKNNIVGATQGGIMGFLKFSPFLVVSILLLYQAGSLHAVPFRSALENSPGMAALSEEEARLLAALVQDYMQMKARELEQEEELEAEGSSITAQKRSCNTATCVTHRLAGLLSRSGGVVKDNFVPTNVGSEAFGRRRRELQA
ncbi:hypothetical protein STEG23_004017, partial [Scotinomys teguina]